MVRLSILCFLLLLSCSRVPEVVSTETSGETEEVPQSPPAEYGQLPRVILQCGETPLWFEFREDGPALIPSPDEASLAPFIPWPLARRMAGILALEDRLILGINREGFLVFVPWEGTLALPTGSSSPGASKNAPAKGVDNAGIVLYQIDNSRYWKDYSVESLFTFDNTPAALLYRDDYFIENSMPPPVSRVWSLDPNGRTITAVPAFEELPPEDGWDLEDLIQGPDERWYYRAVKKGGPGRGIGYFRTRDLLVSGEQSSSGAMQNASQPRLLDQAPALLRQVLEAAFPAGKAMPGIARVVSPEFPSLRYFATPSIMNNIREDIQIFPGYYRPDQESGESAALIISPTGQGFIGTAPGGSFKITEIVLPPLPEGFVYTGTGVFPAKNLSSGDSSMAILASWEEQDGWNVGAAGFVLVGLNFNYE